MKKFVVTIDNKKIFLFIDSEKIGNEFIFSDKKIIKTIPSEVLYLGEVSEIDEFENYLFYKNSNIKSIKINKENNISNLSLSEEHLFFPDLVYLILCMFANIFQNESKYFLQASVVKYDDNKSIMFIGEPNSGKTTMLSKLLLSGNWSLVSNDNVLVGLEADKLSTIAGTKSVQMRYGGIKMFFPEILKKIDLPVDLNEKNEWDVKIYIDSFLKSIGVKHEDKSIVTDIYLISTNKSENINIRKRESIDELLLMYEHLTKQIRSNRYVLTSFDYPIPSFENEKYSCERYNMAKKILQSTNFYDLKGDVDHAILRLRKAHEK